MSADDPTYSDSPVSAIDPAVSRLIFLMMLGLMAGGFVAFRLLSRPPAPAPAEVAGDPLLAQGRTRDGPVSAPTTALRGTPDRRALGVFFRAKRGYTEKTRSTIGGDADGPDPD